VTSLIENNKNLEYITETEFLVQVELTVDSLNDKKKGIDDQILSFSKLYSSSLFYKAQGYNLNYWYNKKNKTIGYNKKKIVVGFRQ